MKLNSSYIKHQVKFTGLDDILMTISWPNPQEDTSIPPAPAPRIRGAGKRPQQPKSIKATRSQAPVSPAIFVAGVESVEHGKIWENHIEMEIFFLRFQGNLYGYMGDMDIIWLANHHNGG